MYSYRTWDNKDVIVPGPDQDVFVMGTDKATVIADAMTGTIWVWGRGTVEASLLRPSPGAQIVAKDMAIVEATVVDGDVTIEVSDQALVRVRAIGAQVRGIVSDFGKLQASLGPGAKISGRGRVLVTEDTPHAQWRQEDLQ